MVVRGAGLGAARRPEGQGLHSQVWQQEPGGGDAARAGSCGQSSWHTESIRCGQVPGVQQGSVLVKSAQGEWGMRSWWLSHLQPSRSLPGSSCPGGG